MSVSVNRLIRPRRPLWLRIILWILVFVIVLLLIVGAIAGYFVLRAHPTTNGEAQLPGLSANASVVRDKAGIPHITAANEDDLFKAMGYVHAQDRLFQMELFRRNPSGQLSAFGGTSTLEDDKLMRVVGMRRTAQDEYDNLTPEQRKPIEDYAAGVNAFITGHKDALPIEFLILGFSPAEWTPVDSLVIGRQIPWTLSGNYNDELTNCDLIAKLGPQRAQQLIPDPPANVTGTVELTSTQGTFDLHNGRAEWPANPNCGNPNGSTTGWQERIAANPLLGHSQLAGSNDWVIDGSKSTTGKPMLANDPHLGLQNPSIWYQIHLMTSDGRYNVAGYSFAGIPGVVVGHNQNIAWGVTNVGPDVQDLFIEKLDPANHPGQYLYRDQWKPYKVITETITVKGQADLVLPVRIIPEHGPLITDVITGTGHDMALAWVGNQRDGLINSVLELDRAQNWEQFRTALSKWYQAGQNFVYADTQGNIGYQATGKVPIRPKGDDGMLPVDGSSGNFDWKDYVPFDALPSLYNPPTHYVATANFRPNAKDYQYFLAARFATPSRITRIREMIAAKDKLSQADMQAIQLDQHSVDARAFGAAFANLKSDDPAVQQAIDSFKNWDGNLSGDSTQAAIYEVAYSKMLELTFKDELGDKLYEEYISNNSYEAGLWMYENLDNPTADFWNNASLNSNQGRDDVLLQSIKYAVNTLQGQMGSNQADWQWNKLHTITFKHPLGSVKPLDVFLNHGPYPVGGDGTTVNVSPFKRLNPTYAQNWIPSYRAVYDLTDWNSTHTVMTLGEATNTGASHINDQTPLWLAGNYLTLPFDQAAIDAAREGTLTLKP